MVKAKPPKPVKKDPATPVKNRSSGFAYEKVDSRSDRQGEIRPDLLSGIISRTEKIKIKLGRPQIEINWEDFDKLCGLQCKLEEIAAWFQCSVDTIENRVKAEKGMLFSEYYAMKKGIGKVNLRRKQYEVAMKGNVRMLIHLGNNELGQSDKHETAIHTPEGKPLQIGFIPVRLSRREDLDEEIPINSPKEAQIDDKKK